MMWQWSSGGAGGGGGGHLSSTGAGTGHEDHNYGRRINFSESHSWENWGGHVLDLGSGQERKRDAFMSNALILRTCKFLSGIVPPR